MVGDSGMIPTYQQRRRHPLTKHVYRTRGQRTIHPCCNVLRVYLFDKTNNGSWHGTWLVLPSLTNDRLRLDIDSQCMGSSHWRDIHVTWVSQPIGTAHNPNNVTKPITNAQRTETWWYNETRLVEYTRHQNSYLFNKRGQEIDWLHWRWYSFSMSITSIWHCPLPNITVVHTTER